MIYRSSKHKVTFETQEDFHELLKVEKDLKAYADGDHELYKKLFTDYVEKLPMKE